MQIGILCLIRAENEGINLILMPAIDQETHLSMLKTEEEFPGNCLSMMGLHPCSVKEGYRQELKIAENIWKKDGLWQLGKLALIFTGTRPLLKSNTSFSNSN